MFHGKRFSQAQTVPDAPPKLLRTMNPSPNFEPQPSPGESDEDDRKKGADSYCPVCAATLIQEKCKVVCRSPRCTYRIIFNCSEF
jgi:hypothetical protein